MTQLEQAITTNLLTVSSDTTVAESILQMSAARASCSLKDDDDQLIWLVTHKSLRQLLHPVDLLRSQKIKISNLSAIYPNLVVV